jgi:hypothetical protein
MIMEHYELLITSFSQAAAVERLPKATWREGMTEDPFDRDTHFAPTLLVVPVVLLVLVRPIVLIAYIHLEYLGRDFLPGRPFISFHFFKCR